MTTASWEPSPASDGRALELNGQDALPTFARSVQGRVPPVPMSPSQRIQAAKGLAREDGLRAGSAIRVDGWRGGGNPDGLLRPPPLRRDKSPATSESPRVS